MANIKTIAIVSASLIGAIGIGIIGYKKWGWFGGSITSTGDNIIIGDSQTPYIASQSNKIHMIGSVGSESNLWLGGKGLSWLKNAVSKYPVSKNVKSVVINIGTNDGFNQNSDVAGLVNEINRVFPNANLFVVQGSWGWGNNTGITNSIVDRYYNLFKSQGVRVINPPIGSTSNPHANLPIYKEIGKNIDAVI